MDLGNIVNFVHELANYMKWIPLKLVAPIGFGVLGFLAFWETRQPSDDWDKTLHTVGIITVAGAGGVVLLILIGVI